MRYCSPDYSLVIMCSCLAGMVGLVIGTFMPRLEKRRPPPD